MSEVKINPKYSGDGSAEFWDTINSIGKRKEELYSLGVVLQRTEEFVLRTLNMAILENVEGNTLDDKELALQEAEEQCYELRQQIETLKNTKNLASFNDLYDESLKKSGSFIKRLYKRYFNKNMVTE